MKQTVLLTGGCGFVGHHFIEHFLKETDWDIITLDRLSYASRGFDRVKDIEVYDDSRVTFLTWDLRSPLSSGMIHECQNATIILHLAAESHVDNSISDPVSTIQSNVMGTVNLLEMARQLNNLESFCYFSTDEVFGPAEKGVDYKEDDRHFCTNPYSASKSASEQICLSYGKCYNLPVFITRSMNIFGERQHPEKFIPLCIDRCLSGELIKIHASSDCKVSGARHYIHARNVVNAIHFLLDKFKVMESYNIVGEKEITNEDLCKLIGDIVGKKPNYELVDFHSSRPGHDLRYSLSGVKMWEMGWCLRMNLEESLRNTIEWTLNRPEWYR